MLRFNLKAEHSAKAWGWRVLLGPAILFDGLFSTLTLSSINPGLRVRVARRLSQARLYDGAQIV